MTLSVENGTFAYKDGKTVLKNIDLQVSAGDLVAVLGPNGAGKTTLLRCMMGFLKWKSGKSLLNGRDIKSLSERKLWQSVAYVPQAKNAGTAFTVGETVLLGRTGRIGLFEKPKARDVEKMNEVLGRLHITHLKNKRCSELSGGELQMVLIARALVSEPSVLILDEPESNLDFKNQMLVLDIMSQAAAEGIACIFNTHYPAHALQRANKAMLLGTDAACVFGNTSAVVNEENIEKIFGVQAKIGEVETPENILKSVVPVAISTRDFTADIKAQGDGRRIAVVSVIASDFAQAQVINALLHAYNRYLIGRMGMPYKACGLYIINVTFDAPQDVVETFAGKIAALPAVSVKTTFAHGSF